MTIDIRLGSKYVSGLDVFTFVSYLINWDFIPCAVICMSLANRNAFLKVFYVYKEVIK